LSIAQSVESLGPNLPPNTSILQDIPSDTVYPSISDSIQGGPVPTQVANHPQQSLQVPTGHMHIPQALTNSAQTHMPAPSQAQVAPPQAQVVQHPLQAQVAPP
jgi:hypothetical protein